MARGIGGASDVAGHSSSAVCYQYTGPRQAILGYSRSLEVDVLQLHGGWGSNGSHSLPSNTAVFGSYSLGAGDLVGCRISVLSKVSHTCLKTRVARATGGTYRFHDAGLEVLALKPGKKKGCGVSGSSGSSASQESDSVETHDENGD